VPFQRSSSSLSLARFSVSTSSAAAAVAGTIRNGQRDMDVLLSD
jgi:hypothetical protein